MTRHMLSFRLDGSCFNYRVAAVIIVDGHVLVCDEDDDGYSMLPGGRVELGESSPLSLAREIAEEVGLPAVLGPLALTSESFYRRMDLDFHELGFFYRVTLPEDARPDGRSPWRVTHDEGAEHRFHWVALDGDGMDQLNLKPDWLREVLRRLPEQLTHVVYDERDDG
ncbi:MAG TPA: NUDIX domain-containing protein [Devosia sp.]